MELNHQYVKEQFELHGCRLLDEYKHSKTPMRYICSCGVQGISCWSNFNRGQRCKKCAIERTVSKHRLTHDYVEAYFKEQSCKLLDKYINSKGKMRYICSCGRESVTTWSRFANGSRCIKCWGEKISKLLKNPNRDQIHESNSLSRRCLAMLRRILKITKAEQTESMELLGYTTQELKFHLTSHPNWNTLKNKKWAIDHIFPIKAFIENDILDIKLMNCLENLRPLDHKENLSKNGKYNREDFIFWLKTKGIDLPV